MRIAVGMSGGVDSSVAAALLKKAGHDVVGVTMLIWDGSKCCSGDAIEDAEWVANHLGIEHHVYDLIPEFTKEIVNPFLDSYTNGRTPNPCPTCNFKMKFNHLWNAVRANMEVDKMATGHYVRLKHNEIQNRYQLYRGLDKNKDQTYMFYRLTQQQLSQLHFPLGHQPKSETRKLAQELGLDPVINKPDSQDLCFVGDSMHNFFDERIPQHIRQGDIIDRSGKVLGHHNGIVHYTIGQRKGLGISSETPLYVLELNPVKNQVIVGERDETFSIGLEANNVNWSGIIQPQTPITAYTKFRYRSPIVKSEIVPLADNKVRIVFAEPQSAIAPGQVVVFYDEQEMLLGGGEIESAINS